MIIKPRRVNRSINSEINKQTAEPQTPPIVGSGSPARKNQDFPRNKRNGQENKKVEKKPVEAKKSALEILMGED